MTRTTRRTLLLAAASLLATPLATIVHAQQPWPARPVTLVVPFTAGGTTDIVARLMARKLGQMWNQSVVIDNRVGAGGNIGTAMVAKAAPDGYTVLLTSGAITINPHLYKSPGYSMKELTPVTNIASGPMVVVVNPSVPAANVQELIALAKAKPGTLNFGSAGPGSQVHMAGENFADAAHIEIVHVPYKGESVALSDLVGGQIQMMVGNIAGASGFVKSGQLRALAVTSKQRSKMLPAVPTVDESGLPGFENSGWFGFFVPAGTPTDIVDKIYRDTVKALNDPETEAALAAQGMVAIGNAPSAFAGALNDELARWGKIVAQRRLTTN
ncbi:MAG: tripartite tricarboxylate transporter substrate binding protein [Burkholderiales bacterium]|nr:tripartite tricarboxylate transporter substrate binding protein [Burkholderiales bacterium]